MAGGKKRLNRQTAAFTLVEIMVVVVIIGVLATVVTVSVTDYLVTAKQNVARTELATLRNALALYYMENDRYPTNDEGLAALTQRNARHPHGIITNDLQDPWGREYIYIYPGVNGPYALLSFGADGLEGGAGADADIHGNDAPERETQ